MFLFSLIAEVYCGSFRCNVTHKCLPQGWVCDGEADCGSGDTSDEDNATCKSHSHLQVQLVIMCIICIIMLINY